MESTHSHHFLAIYFDYVGQARLLNQPGRSAENGDGVSHMVQRLVALEVAIFPNHSFIDVTSASMPVLGRIAKC